MIEAPGSGLSVRVVDDGLFGDNFRTIFEGSTFPFPGASVRAQDGFERGARRVHHAPGETRLRIDLERLREDR